MTQDALPLTSIRLDGGTQVRAAINDAIVVDYAEQMANGTVFPPIAVFHDGDTHYLADGYHRYLAAQRRGLTVLLADVHPGTREDALWFALGANRANGHQLTPQDKTHAIRLAVATWPARLQREIAEQVGCAQSLVSHVVTAYANINGDIPVLRGRALVAHQKRAAVRAMVEAGARPGVIRDTVGAHGQVVADVRRELKLSSIDRSTEAANARRERMRELAADGNTSHQIAAELGLSLAGCRQILKDAQIRVPADVVTRNTRHLNATRIMSQIVTDAENLSAGTNLIDFAALDHAQIDDWITRLRTSRTVIAKLIKLLLQEKLNGEAA